MSAANSPVLTPVATGMGLVLLALSLFVRSDGSIGGWLRRRYGLERRSAGIAFACLASSFLLMAVAGMFAAHGTGRIVTATLAAVMFFPSFVACVVLLAKGNRRSRAG